MLTELAQVKRARDKCHPRINECERQESMMVNFAGLLSQTIFHHVGNVAPHLQVSQQKALY
jgi:hypothetical protein